MQAVVAGFLVIHGFITTRIGVVGISDPAAPAVVPPAWLAWWPGPLGRSWLFDVLGLGSAAAVVGGLLWLAAGLALIGAGLGWLGVPVLASSWQGIALAGAALGLVALGIYFHPVYLLAVAIDVLIVVLASGALSSAH